MAMLNNQMVFVDCPRHTLMTHEAVSNVLWFSRKLSQLSPHVFFGVKHLYFDGLYPYPMFQIPPMIAGYTPRKSLVFHIPMLRHM